MFIKTLVNIKCMQTLFKIFLSSQVEYTARGFQLTSSHTVIQQHGIILLVNVLESHSTALSKIKKIKCLNRFTFSMRYSYRNSVHSAISYVIAVMYTSS